MLLDAKVSNDNGVIQAAPRALEWSLVATVLVAAVAHALYVVRVGGDFIGLLDRQRIGRTASEDKAQHYE